MSPVGARAYLAWLILGLLTLGGTAAAQTPGPGSISQVRAAESVPTQIQREVTVTPVETNFLARFLGIAESPVKIYGWLANSYTYNANGRPAGDLNFSVFPNRLANSWQGDQYYLVIEKPAQQVDTINLGFRFDSFLGNDWEFSKDYGLFDRAFSAQFFRRCRPSSDVPRGAPAGAHQPRPARSLWQVLLPLGLRVGHGDEAPLAVGALHLQLHPVHVPRVPVDPARQPPAQPHQRRGQRRRPLVQRELPLQLHRRVQLDFERRRHECRARTFWSDLANCRSFHQLNTPFLPLGVPQSPPSLAGKPNHLYAHHPRTYFDVTVTHKWNERLTQAAQAFFIIDTDVVLPTGRILREASWYGAANWFLYAFDADQKYTGVWRAEVFEDSKGTATGDAGTYYETTLGLIYKPKPWLWIRPEARYDWVEGANPFSDGTRNNQLTASVDVIIQF